jgi:hypothetical protein
MTIRVLSIAVALALPISALAQAPPASKPPVEPKAEHGNVNPCADAPATVGKGRRDVDAKQPQQDKNLSQKLAQSNGVICPPPTADPGIRKPAPPGGPMPVIPPPGAPSGDPNVQPK